MREMVRVDGLKLESAIFDAGYNLQEMSTICDRNMSYVSTIKKYGQVDRSVLAKICMVIQKDINEFITTQPNEVKPEANDDKLTNIDDALASMTKMLEQIQNNTKVIADNIQTISNTNYAGTQEAKRFYQTCAGMFNRLDKWMRSFNKGVE